MIDAITSSATAVGAPAAAGGPTLAPLRGAAPAEVAGGNFAAMLGDLVANAAGVVKNAEAVSIAGVKGQASVQQVVEAVMSAEHTLQSAIAVRDKVVSAYLEISRMQI